MKNKKLKLLLLVISIVLLISIIINIKSEIKENNNKQQMEALDYKTESNLTYAVEVEKEADKYIVACLIFEDKIDGIEEIESPNGNRIMTPGKTKIALDYKLERDTDRTFKIKSRNGEITTVNINASNYVYSGDGTDSNPYIIKTAVLLQRITKNLSAHYKLGANIDLSEREWTIIGNDSTPFSGSIDGDGYTISNLTVESTGNNVGLFGKSTGVIKDITVENFNVKGNSNVGVIVGQTTNAISNCKVTGSIVTGTGDNVGGIVGYTTGNVTNSTADVEVIGRNQVGGAIGYAYALNKSMTTSGNSATGSVTGVGNVGGLIGYANQIRNATGESYTYVKQSYATGEVTATGDNIGGLIGRADSVGNHNANATKSTKTNLNIETSYSTGIVKGKNNIGGLIGYVVANVPQSGRNIYANFNLKQSYVTGDVNATGNKIGGLIGYVDEDLYSYAIQGVTGTIENSFATGKVTGTSEVGGLIGYLERAKRDSQSSSDSYINTNITNTYAVGEVKTTAGGNAGGLISTIQNTTGIAGSNTIKNSYWSPETTKQSISANGTGKDIQRILYKSGYDNWDFEQIWTIEENQTLAYLKNLPKPEDVNKEKLEYEVYEIVGTGTTADPYIITTPVQLQKINGDLAANYKIAANIDLSGREWITIGNSIYPFKGSLDGDGYTVSNLIIDSTSDNQGLFGVVTTGVINNVTIENFNIKGNANVGTLVGNATGTEQINNCKVKESTVEGTGANVGGLVGYTTRKMATAEVTNTEVKGTTQTGGLVGNTTGVIDNVILEGVNVLGTSQVGGLTGNTTNAVSNITANIEVTGTENQVGGLVGNTVNTVKEVTVKGQVTGTSQTGGVIGYTTNAITGANIHDLTVNGTSNIGGAVGQTTNTISTIEILGNVTVTGTGNNVGGTVGYTTYTVTEVKATGETINGVSYVGGVVGQTTNEISNCEIKESILTGTGDNIGGTVGYTVANVTGSKTDVTIKGRNQVGGVIGYVYALNKTITASGNSATGSVTGVENVGGLIGYANQIRNTTGESYIYIKQSYATGDVTATGDNIGGLIGRADSVGNHSANATNSTRTNLNVETSYATGIVKGKNNTGGLIGYVVANAPKDGRNIYANFDLKQCYATGDVIASGNNIGGLIGNVYEALIGWASQTIQGTIENSFATGNVTGASNIGGLIGYVQRAKNDNSQGNSSYVYTYITNTYAVGEVTTTASGYKGGLVGRVANASGINGSSTVKNSYWSPETTKQETSALGTPKDIQVLLYKSGYNSWDFEKIWGIEENDTLAYLRNVDKPEDVYKDNFKYEVYEIDGNGTTEDPYIITTPLQLQRINGDLGANYKIAENIDLSETEWIPIGNSTYPFKGTLDGDGHIVTNLVIDSTSDNQGLFGVVTAGTINNVIIESFNIKGNANVGSLIGNTTGTVQINNCKVKQSTVEGTGTNVGGLIGNGVNNITESKIENTIVKGTTQVGGLVGNTTGMIDSAILEEVRVSGEGQVGGLVGNTTNKVSNITANIEVTGVGTQVGGIVGNTTNTISEVAVKGIVTGANQTGGVVGYTTLTVIGADIQDLTVTGASQVGGIVGQTTNAISIIEILENVIVTGTENNVGGVVGYTTGTITEVNATSLVIEGVSNIGGVVGNTTNTINNCNVKSSILTATGDNVGGIVGYIISEVKNSSADIEVTGRNRIGGIIGYLYIQDKTITITGNTASGSVTGSGENIGGLIGYSYAMTTKSASSSYDATININKSNSTMNVIGNGNNVGGLIGKAETFTNYANVSSTINIEQNYATGNIVSTGNNIGGLIGNLSVRTVENTYVSPKAYANIKQSYATGEVSTSGNNVGGFIGYIYEYYYDWDHKTNVAIENVYETGKVKGGSNVGGLIGYIQKSKKDSTTTKYENANIQITNTYSVGEVTVTQEDGYAGGMVGRIGGNGIGANTVTSSYWSPETTKQTASALGESRSIELLLTQSGYNSWDFTSIWTIEENSTLAYLRNLLKPESVKKESLQY